MTCKDDDIFQERQNLFSVIKEEIHKSIDEEYSNYKNQCLKDLERKIEIKRNETVCDVLNSIDIITENQRGNEIIVIKIK